MAACAPEYPTRVKRFDLTIDQEQPPDYAAGDQVGDLAHWDIVTEAGTKAGVTFCVVGHLASTDTPALDIWFFERETTPSADNSPAGFTGNVPRDHFLGHVEVTAGDWSTSANEAVFTRITTLPAHWFNEGEIGRVYGAVIARSVYTPVDLTIGIAVLVD